MKHIIWIICFVQIEEDTTEIGEKSSLYQRDDFWTVGRNMKEGRVRVLRQSWHSIQSFYPSYERHRTKQGFFPDPSQGSRIYLREDNSFMFSLSPRSRIRRGHLCQSRMVRSYPGDGKLAEESMTARRRIESTWVILRRSSKVSRGELQYGVVLWSFDCSFTKTSLRNKNWAKSATGLSTHSTRSSK